MLRPLLAALANLVLLLVAVLRGPFRVLRRRPAPAYVHFLLKRDPPYRQPLQRRWPWRRERHAPGQVTSLHVLDGELDALAGDPAVKGIVLEIQSLDMPAGKRAWIAERLAAFRARGKEVVGTAVSAGNGEYALLCAADRIALPRAGRLELAGFLVEATAAGRAFELLGIRPEFVRRGEHKTAPELFIRAEVSPNQRAALEQFLDERHADLVDVVARGRHLSPEDARARVDQGPYSATRAQALGLVDLIADDVELPAALGLDADEDRALAGSAGIGTFRDRERARRWPRTRWMAWRRPTRLAVVPISGMIAQAPSGAPPVGSHHRRLGDARRRGPRRGARPLDPRRAPVRQQPGWQRARLRARARRGPPPRRPEAGRRLRGPRRRVGWLHGRPRRPVHSGRARGASSAASASSPGSSTSPNC